MNPLEQLKAAYAVIAEETLKGDGRDKERLAKALRDSEAAIKAMHPAAAAAAVAGADGPGAIEAWKAEVQGRIDKAIDQVREFQRLGIPLTGRGTVSRVGLAERREMFARGQCFADDEVAERFGALMALGRLHDAAPQRSREIGLEVLKTAGITRAVDWDPATSSTGGAVIPDEFIADIIRNVEAVGRIYTRMRRIPLVTLGDTTIPKRTAGLTAYWMSPATDITQSGVTLGTVVLSPKKLTAMTGVPNEFFRSRLLVNLGNFIGTEIVYSIAYALDNAAVNGDGTSTYGEITGILQSATLTTVTLAAHQTGATADEDDLDNIDQNLTNDYAQDGATWLMNLGMVKRFKNLRSATGERLVWDGGGGGLPATLNGYPFLTSSRFPAVASVTAGTSFCAFGDLALSHMLGMLQDIGVTMSEHVWFGSDATAVRGITHANIQEAETGALVVGKTHA